MQNREKYLVTSALPYANGPLHIGHVAGAYLPADIFVRFQKSLGNDVIYICGSDQHGAPISIKAEAEGVSPREIAEFYHNSIKQSFAGLLIEFDNFSGTARAAHTKLSQDFFTNLFQRGFIVEKTTKQWYDQKQNRFLADRYVEGVCPYCSAEGARGDQCDACGKLIDAVELINPISKISGTTPILKETTHWYLELQKFEAELKEWLSSKTYWKENVHNFISNFLESGLLERAITRDIDWGVPVPLENAEGKVLYVWFDAPIGYISSTKEWAEKIGKPERWKDYWLDQETKLIHFIGKDNIIFHTIFFPSFMMEQPEPYVLPHDVPANEFLNLEGRKMSTSKNWTVWVNDYLENFEGEYLRYYLAANAPENKDSDFYWKEFQQQINNDLANVLGNLANRVFAFTKKSFAGKINKPTELSQLSASTLNSAKILTAEIKQNYSEYKVRRAVKNCIEIARIGNRYFDETKPWAEVKAQNMSAANETLYVCAEILRLVSITLAPVIPQKMSQLRTMMNLQPQPLWSQLDQIISDLEIAEIKPLFKKIEDAEIQKQLDKLAAATKALQVPELEHKAEMEFDDFMKLELRIGLLEKVEKIKKANKLLRVTADFGGEKRQVVAGLAKAYQPEELVGKKVAMLLNLKPRKVMGVLSNAMILAASDEEGKLSVLTLDRDLAPGSEIS
ncbi:MAG: methionine--tRNA ligase [Candidatus Cloacimonadales bacterium]